MRHYLFLSLFLSSSIFALSCPNNGKILQVGDSIQEALDLCGQPKTTNSHVTTTIISSEWTYYIPNPQGSTKLTIRFFYDKIVSMNVMQNSMNGQNTSSFNQCRSPIQIGNTKEYTKSVCDDPVAEKTLQTETIKTTEFQYDTSRPNTLIFENDKLTDWQ